MLEDGVLEKLGALLVTEVAITIAGISRSAAAVENILAALINASASPEALLRLGGMGIGEQLHHLLASGLFDTNHTINTRAVLLLSRCTSVAGVSDAVIKLGTHKLLLKLAKAGPNTPLAEHAVLSLTKLVMADNKMVQLVREEDQFVTMVELLSSSNLKTVGNSALFLQEVAKNSTNHPLLRSTEVVPRLVGIAHKQTGAVQKNAAIALGHMAKDEQMRQTIRDLHGFEIIMSYVKM
jgi:hypothetical protein